MKYDVGEFCESLIIRVNLTRKGGDAWNSNGFAETVFITGETVYHTRGGIVK